MDETTVYTTAGVALRSSKNLRAMLEAAGEHGGVKRITIKRAIGIAGREAIVRAYYTDGCFAESMFAEYRHACSWAMGKKVRRATWFTGCIIETEGG